MPDGLGKLKRLHAAATPGEWRATWQELPSEDVRVCYQVDGECQWCVALAGDTIDGQQWDEQTLQRWRNDAEAIARLHNAAPSLFAAIDAADLVSRFLDAALSTLEEEWEDPDEEEIAWLRVARSCVSCFRAAIDKIGVDE